MLGAYQGMLERPAGGLAGMIGRSAGEHPSWLLHGERTA